MRILIVINNLLCGGAQKSLISLLNAIQANKINIDLLVLNPQNAFFTSIPTGVRWLETPKEINAMYLSASELRHTDMDYKLLCRTICAKVVLKLRKDKSCSDVQNLWMVWKHFIPKQKKEYDLAVSYVDGFSNYYVIDKVSAKKKILWFHNEYEKLNYGADFDRNYFGQADAIVTISEACVDSLKRFFPQFEEKIHLLYNLSSPEIIWQMGQKEEPEEYYGKKNILVSVGRLNEQKGFDLAIEAATKLNAYGIDFAWYIIGEGELEAQLKHQIVEFGLEQCMFLLGLRKNPYTYIHYADLFVQPSRYEGKSIVLDEAKILRKPIVATNYTTVYDSIIDRRTGSIVTFDADELALAIKELLENKELQEEYQNALEKEYMASEKYVVKYMDLFNIVLQEYAYEI